MDPVFHAVIPALVLLSVNIDSKKVFALLPLALTPDLDGFFGLWAHRVVFHNFIFVLLVPLIILLIVRKKFPEKLSFVYVGWFYLISHLILDLQGGFAFLWPFSSKAPYFSFEITTNTTGLIPRLFFDVNTGIASRAPEYSGEGSFLTPTASLILILLFLSVFMNRSGVLNFVKDFKKFSLEKLSSLKKLLNL